MGDKTKGKAKQVEGELKKKEGEAQEMWGDLKAKAEDRGTTRRTRSRSTSIATRIARRAHLSASAHFSSERREPGTPGSLLCS